MAAVELRNVSKSFGPVVVIDDVTAAIQAGEFVAFVGPSGSGKSTLLRLIAGLEDVSSGDILIDEEDVTFEEPSDRGVAMVFQSYALYPHMNVYDNIAFNLRLSRLPKSEIDARVRQAASILRIDGLLARSPAQLSGGQRQRVAIGRAIVRNPKVFLFDEPLSNLDAALRVQMRLEIGRLHRELGATTVYVTHDQVEAMTMADRILVLDSGKVQQAGSPAELYATPRNRFVAGFLGSPRMNFLEARAAGGSERGTAFATDGAASAIAFVPGLSLTAATPVTLGFRPESVKVFAGAEASPPGQLTLTGRIETVERLGNISFAYVNVAEQVSVTVQMVGPVEFSHGDQVDLGVLVDQIHVFDGTGVRLKPATPQTIRTSSMGGNRT